MTKMQISGRIETNVFQEFKEEYLKQLKASFVPGVDKVMLKEVTQVTNTELMEIAFIYANEYLKVKQ